ncbi:hypothetical protein B0J18DRAFT_181812 [Chaetomium sp. MPI-SDFR-AT-0129]|nr:hypothetical protein B0J18DRAFT_181812 [Chaetomium sp. MPI-SDFR-AT-0129]
MEDLPSARISMNPTKYGCLEFYNLRNKTMEKPCKAVLRQTGTGARGGCGWATGVLQQPWHCSSNTLFVEGLPPHSSLPWILLSPQFARLQVNGSPNAARLLTTTASKQQVLAVAISHLTPKHSTLHPSTRRDGHLQHFIPPSNPHFARFFTLSHRRPTKKPSSPFRRPPADRDCVRLTGGSSGQREHQQHQPVCVDLLCSWPVAFFFFSFSSLTA